jgi:hypothetical protein
MSAIVERFQSQMTDLRDKGDTMAYFYFNDQADKQTHRAFLFALLHQLITLDSVLSAELLEDFAAIDFRHLSTTKLQEKVQLALREYRTSYLLVDGADECSKEEAQKSIKWLLSLARSTTEGARVPVRVLISGRRDGVLDVTLGATPEIPLDEIPSHSSDILDFCEKMADRIQAKLRIPDSLKNDIVSRVHAHADGMPQHQIHRREMF